MTDAEVTLGRLLPLLANPLLLLDTRGAIGAFANEETRVDETLELVIQ